MAPTTPGIAPSPAAATSRGSAAACSRSCALRASQVSRAPRANRRCGPPWRPAGDSLVLAYDALGPGDELVLRVHAQIDPTTEDVRLAVLETSGRISVIPRS